jgi:DNA-binding GntR family transcriptional regulator
MASEDGRPAASHGLPQPIGSSHRTLRQTVADEIHGMILRGDLAPGDRLVEDRLAEQLGVSRNPVREAFRLLEATGLVEVLPRRGAYVASFDLQDLQELLELRGAVESYAAGRAAERATPDDVAAIDRWIADGVAATEAGDPVRAAECHRGFHVEVERIAANRYLDDVVQPLRNRTEMVFSLLLDEKGHISWAEHVRARDAIAAGDADDARAQVRRHLQRVLENLRSRIDA